jgi:murein DD-endopeptidase MepM/ murein hydrolase activator NlpD
MKHQFVKKNKMLGRDLTVMIIPDSGDKKIKSYRIPFVLTLVIMSFIIFNIYIFFGFTVQVWHISRLRQDITTQTELNAKLTAEKRLVKPLLDKSRDFDAELAHYRQEYRNMFETWKRVRQKGNLRFTLASRGGFRSGNKTNSYILAPIAKTKAVVTSIDQLDYNLNQLKNILRKETQEQDRLLQKLQAYERHLDHTPSIWPVNASIVSPFGKRFHPIFRKYILHEGVDLGAEYGTRVRATADGTVSFAGWEEGYGYVVMIEHDYGCETRYAHNSQLFVYPGEIVKKGQIISRSGNTGESTGPHLHYEVRINDKPVNPLSFLKE